MRGLVSHYGQSLRIAEDSLLGDIQNAPSRALCRCLEPPWWTVIVEKCAQSEQAERHCHWLWGANASRSRPNVWGFGALEAYRGDRATMPVIQRRWRPAAR